MKQSKLFTLAFLLGTGFLFSCDPDEDPTPPVDPSTESAVNDWIFEVMSQVYYWLDDMNTPVAADSEPEDYFESLLNRPTDRFSAIYPNYQDLINSLSGVTLEAGYEFTLLRESQSNENVVAAITYIKKNSPAASAGLMRGDIINEINGVQITLNNYQQVLGDISSTHKVNYLRFNEDLNGYEEKEEATLNTIELAENPVFIDTVYAIDNAKIGYLMYNFFAPGTGGSSTTYDQEIDAVFAKFKSESIQHLIVDLRYNGGGYVTSAVNLASLIGPGVGASDVFSKTKYNSFLSQYDDFKNVQTPFKVKAENLGATLEGNRVYVLTSGRTASASELLVNGLKPYMDVFLIGDVTYGKNVGSIAFEDEENNSNPYGILPIVSQSFNSLDQSDYTTGFSPNIEAQEFTERLRPLGDTQEIMLRTAIEQITGTASSLRVEKLDRQEIGSSLDYKVRQGIMIENKRLD